MKELSLKARLDRAHRNIKVKEEFHLRHLYISNGGNHLSMSRVLNEQQASSSVPEVVLSHIQCTTQRRIDPSSLNLIDFLTGEQRMVR